MHNTLSIQDFVFETNALSDAVSTIDTHALPDETGFSPEALSALVTYFCDWGSVRNGDINAAPSDELATMERGEQEALFTTFAEELSSILQTQYSLDSSAEEIRRLAHAFADPDLNSEIYTFLLSQLTNFSSTVGTLDPNETSSTDTAQELLTEIHRLPQPYLQAKENQYAGSTKVNEIRYQLLKSMHTDGEITIEELERIKANVTGEYDSSILRNWRNYTIIGQLYYDYFKPRMGIYLETIAERLLDEFATDELVFHIIDYQGPQNFLSDHAWIALHTPPEHAQKDRHQLYLGFHKDHISVGLHVGSNLREGDWETNRDLKMIDIAESLSFSQVLEKLRSVNPQFESLAGITDGQDTSFEIPSSEPDRASEIIRQLDAKKQVVFYGPPGTGKTHVATEFARWWVNEETEGDPDPTQVQSVTFHPAFSYEDFLEGLEASATDTGAVTYDVEDGILKRIARQARQAASTTDGEAPPYILIIDEINRGNLAQIFGETITLLEADKRETQTAQLAHSDEEFTIPSNLYVIGTMNTADRSIALVDAALRRRFRFLQFPPDYDVLLQEHGFVNKHGSADWSTIAAAIEDEESAFRTLLALSITALRTLNDRIVDAPDLSKGQQIGHSYLFDVESVDNIVDAWRFDILPLLEEYYFGQFDRIQRHLFDGAGEEIIDWQAERVRAFDDEALVEFLGQFVDRIPAYSPQQSSTDGGTSARRQTPQYPVFLESVMEEVFERVGDTLNADTAADLNYKENLERTTLGIQSQHPDHPDPSFLRYAFQPKVHLDDSRFRIAIYADDEFRSTVNIDFQEVLDESELPADQFDIGDKTYPTVGGTISVDTIEDVYDIDGDAFRAAVGESTVQEAIDLFVDLIETVHPICVAAETDDL